MTKIEPVSKAAADFFKNKLMALDDDFNLFLYFHGVEEDVDDTPFAVFCRAVADQLDPSVYTANANAQVCLTKTSMRKCFRIGFDCARDESKVKVRNMGLPYELPTEMIDIELKKQGLLGDTENDNL